MKKDKASAYLFLRWRPFLRDGSSFNVYVLTLLPYSIVFPLTSITYIWTLTFGYFLIKEKVTTKQVIGCILLIVGCFFIAS